MPRDLAGVAAVLLLGAALMASSQSARAAEADAFPSRTIRIVVGFAPGGGTDTVARLLAPRLQASLGRPVVVENRAGATGTIAAAMVAKAEPDGHTLLLGANSTNAIAPAVYKRLPYDSVNGLLAVSMVASVPHLIAVSKSTPATSLKELIESSKAAGARMSYGTPGNASAPHLVGEMFKSLTGARVEHIPYRGAGPALGDLVAGHVTVSFDTSTSLLAHIQSGAVRPLAITSASRLAQFPDVPTVAEAGLPGLEVSTWMGVFVPAKTPRTAVDKLAGAIRSALDDPQVRQELVRNVGSQTSLVTAPSAFEAFVKKEAERYAALVNRLSITLD